MMGRTMGRHRRMQFAFDRKDFGAKAPGGASAPSFRRIVALLVTGSVIVLAQVVLGTQPVAAQSAVAVTITAQPGVVVNGSPFSAAVTVTPTTTGETLTGCYALVAHNLPAGLQVAPSSRCAGSPAASLGYTVSGTAHINRSQPLLPVSVTFTVYPLEHGSRVSKGVGTAVVDFSLLPAADVPSVANSYANLGLSAVDCPDSVCWVVGLSNNPPSGPSVPVSGESPKMVVIQGATTATHLRVPEGGTFIAQLVKSSPLDLRFVRTGISFTISGFACPDTETCVGVGSSTVSGHPARPLAFEMSNSGSTWHAYSDKVVTAGSFAAIDCPDAENCMAVGSETTSGGKTVGLSQAFAPSSQSNPFGDAATIGTTGNLGGISCVDASTCFATGGIAGDNGPTNDGRIFVSHNFGGNWQGDQITTTGPGCTITSCPRTAQPWYQLVTAQMGFGTLASMGCARGSHYYCATAWPFLSNVANTTDGKHWLVGELSSAPYGLSGGIDNPVSCASVGHCFTITSPLIVCGYDFACTHVAIYESMATVDSSQTFGGAEWGLVGFGPPGTDQPGLSDISCPTVDGCVAVGKWQPHGSAAWSPVFPLVIGTEAADHPYFVPQPNYGEQALVEIGGNILSIGGDAVGIASVFMPELAPIALVLGGTSVVTGLASCGSISWGCFIEVSGAAGLAIGPLGIPGAAVDIYQKVTGTGDPEQPIEPEVPLPSWLAEPDVPEGGPMDE